MAIFCIAVIAIKIIVVVYYAKIVILQIKKLDLIITMNDLLLLRINEILIDWKLIIKIEDWQRLFVNLKIKNRNAHIF